VAEGEPLKEKVRVATWVREPVAEVVELCDAHALGAPLRVRGAEPDGRLERLGEPLGSQPGQQCRHGALLVGLWR
jgi:hypothetical protein